MKFLIAFSCLLAAAYAKAGVGYSYSTSTNVVSGQYAPVAYTSGQYAPVAYSGQYTPYAYGQYAPAAYSYTPVAHTVAAAPVVSTYSAAPVTHTVAAAPVVSTSNVVSHSAVATPVVAHSAVATPVVAHSAVAAPVVAPVVAPAVVKTQYHAQNEIGQASYGHSEPLQAHNAVQDAAGNKVGSYSYVAPNGQVIATNYVADALGYRVSSNAAPGVVVDTPEVAAAKAAHLNAQFIARKRGRRSVAAYYAAPVAHSAYYAAPVAHSAYYAAPVVSTAAVSHVVNTPVFYGRG